MSATTIVMMLSFAAAPRPATIRAPRNDSYDVASADQIFAAIQMPPQSSVIGRRPKMSAAGTMMKFAYPSAMTQAPVYKILVNRYISMLIDKLTRSAICDSDLFHSATYIGVRGAIDRFVATLISTNMPWLMIVEIFQNLFQFYKIR